MNQYIRQLRHYAEHNPKGSSLLLIGGTVVSCGAIVGFIELRDRYKYSQRHVPRNGAEAASSAEITPGEAQLAAMLETAKKSTWQENLRNAAYAQERFMLPGQEVSGHTPEYVRRIDERSEEIMRKEKERQEKQRESDNDPSRSRFWK